MSSSSITFWQKPLVKGIRYGFLTLFLSYLPTLLVCIVHWGQNHLWPGFEFVFDSGGMLSIWIPIFVMLLFSLYGIREHRICPVGEDMSFFLVVIISVILMVLYPFFFFGLIEYGAWVKWMSWIVVFILFCILCFSRYLEYSAPHDLQSTRAKEQDTLEEKVINIGDHE